MKLTLPYYEYGVLYHRGEPGPNEFRVDYTRLHVPSGTIGEGFVCVEGPCLDRALDKVGRLLCGWTQKDWIFKLGLHGSESLL